jgi:translation initiation factor IF-3
MAEPIEPTPILRGEDAVRFIKMAENPEPPVVRKIDYKKVTEEIKRIYNERTKKQLHV